MSNSNTFELFEDQLELLEFAPDGLLCAPILNAHGILVGVFQVVTRKHPHVSLGLCVDTPGDADANGTSKRSGALSAEEKESFSYICSITGTAIWNISLAKSHQLAQSRIECLIKLNRNISAEVNTSAVLAQIIAVSYELLNAEKIVLYVRDEGTNVFYIAGSHSSLGAKDEYLTEHNGIVGFVMRTGQLILTNFAQSHPEFDPTYDEKMSFLTRQVLCAPVKDADSNVLAVICASNKVNGDEFSPEDALYLNYVADGAGISLHKANLLRQVITSQRITEARLRLADFVARSTSVTEFVGVVMAEGKRLMGCDRFGFLLVDDLKKELWITHVDGQNVRMPLSKGLSGLVATTGETLCVRDAYTHELFDPTLDRKTGYRTTSVLCMPVFEDHTSVHPKIVAVAMGINKLEGTHVVPFTSTDMASMTRFCREIQFALGRLSLDISYYKVVSDCGLQSEADGDALKEREQAGASGDRPTAASVVNMASPEPMSEAQIISSLVHKYCQPGEVDGGLVLDLGDAVDDGLVDFSVFEPASDETLGVPLKLAGMGRESSVVTGVGDLEAWDLDCLDLSPGAISVATGVIFRTFGLLEAFRVSPDKFATFVSHVATHYRANPFHNLQHAFQVLHATSVLLRRDCGRWFSALDMLVMLLAALCHDIDHPGNTNDFELKARSQMALTHNDDAVLERHHCRVTFLILGHKSANILEHLSPARFVRARRLIIQCILATDMAKHVDNCKALDLLTRRQLPEKKYVLMGVVMHAADLSGQALPYSQAARWGMRMLTEFQAQAKHEQELLMSVDSFMANLHHIKARVTVQMNFINYVLRPLWLPLATLCPALRVYVDALEHNFDRHKLEFDRLSSDARAPMRYTRGDSKRLLGATASSHDSAASPRNSGNAMVM